MKHGARGADRELGRPAAAGGGRSRRARRAHEDLRARRRRATHERHSAVHRTRRRDALQAHDFRVDVRVVVGEAKNAVRAPLGALFRRGDGWAVYKVVDGRAVATEVGAGQADGRFRAITSGLAEGDEVIVFPSGEITDGARVKPWKERGAQRK